MKIQRKRLAGALAYALGVGGWFVASMPAQAADEKIYVTGSRIISLVADSPSPLQTITADEIAASGAMNIQDVLLKNPTVGTPLISRTNSNFQNQSAGVATVDLRNLGTARTLVLIDGRRVVSGVPGSSAVDLNIIPVNFIERIDILTGGASPAYGSDAVAGVINIIMKRNFEGVKVDGQFGKSGHGDDTNGWVNATFGTVGAGGRANLMGFLGYTNQGPVYSKNRDATKTDQFSLEECCTGELADMFKIQRPFFSSFAPQGRFFTNLTSSKTFDQQGNLIPFSTNGPAGDGVGATGFNRSQFRTIAVPIERFLFSAKGDYNFFESHTAYFEGSLAQTNVTSKLEPFPLNSAGSNGIYPVGGRAPAATLVNGVVVPNPLIPTALYNLLADTNGDGIKDYGFTRRLTEVGNRGNVADRDTFRMVAGLRGAVTKSWDYDVNIIFGSTTESQTSGGQVNVASFANALNAIPDAFGNPICVSATARAQGCVPINIFGFNTISAGALKYVIAPVLLSTYTSQMLVTATVGNTEAFEGPAGPVAVAIGAEYRNEYSRNEFDALTQAGLNANNQIPATKGSFHVADMFFETRVPLLKNESYAKSLDLTGALRGGKYSTVGTTWSYSAGLEWAPTSQLKVRATAALATRAPDINELFSPPTQDFPTGLVDPCAGVTATSQGTKDNNCRAATGVNQNIAANGVFTRTQADLQGISGFDRGNPDLQEEKGHSYTAGVIYKPTSIEMLKNFLFTADYFNIKINDAIVSTPRQFILDQCYSGNSSFCNFITRRPTISGANSAGSLEFIDSAVTNSGGVSTAGIDFTAAYTDMVGPGRLNARFAYTHVFKGYLIPLPGEPKDQFNGEIGSPKNKWNLNLGYDWGPWGATLQTTYLGKSALDDQFLLSDGFEPRSATVSARVYNALQVTYTAGKVQYYGGIDNLLDTKAPPIISGLPGNNTGTETDAGTYDPIGRRFYIGVRVSL